MLANPCKSCLTDGTQNKQCARETSTQGGQSMARERRGHDGAPPTRLGGRPAFARRSEAKAGEGMTGVNYKEIGQRALERDDFSSNRHHALTYSWSMIFSENRFPLFGIML